MRSTTPWILFLVSAARALPFHLVPHRPSPASRQQLPTPPETVMGTLLEGKSRHASSNHRQRPEGAFASPASL